MTDKRSLQDDKSNSQSRPGDGYKQEYNPAKNNPKMDKPVSKNDQQSKTSR